MKRLLSLLLALALVLSLVGCQFTHSGTPSAPAQTEPSQALTTAPTQQPTAPSQPAQTLPEETLPAQTDPAPTLPEQTDPPTTQPAQEEFPEDTRPRPTVPEQDQLPVETLPPETLPEQTEPQPTEPSQPSLDRYGAYTSKNDVALYLHLYGRLPYNFITKSEAKSYGWKSGSLEKYAPGKCIGGDRFYNNEGLLPNAPGRYYYECDIDTLGSYSGRGAKRIVYSNDGLIYYTGDHYGSFTLLYGEP